MTPNWFILDGMLSFPFYEDERFLGDQRVDSFMTKPWWMWWPM